jgi:hypothetical protein
MKKKSSKKEKLYSINALNMHLKEIKGNIFKGIKILQKIMAAFKISFNS